jgi:hypothetical protein
MKTICENDVRNGLSTLLGKVVHLYCCRYIYRGKLVAIDDTSAIPSVILADAGIVYETGELTSAPKDFQRFKGAHGVQIASIESWGEAPDA